SAVIVSDDMAIGLYGCRPLCGDFICADSITKSTCCYGVENVSAWLYYGNEERAKSLQSAALPTDAVWHILFTDGFSFSSNGVEFEVKKTQDGCVGALKNGSEWSGTPNNLFTVNAKDFVLTSDRGWKEVEFFSDGIEFSQNESVPSAKVVVRVKETDVGLDLRIECTGIPALWDVIFPSFRIYPTKGEADLFIPSASGRIEKNVISLPVHYREPYSAPFSNMSYLGCFDKDGIGCYFEWKGRGERRDYCVDSFSSKGILTVKSRLYPENMLNTDSYTSPFIGVCRTEKGWWGMASLYKSHVKNMPWYRTDHKRHDTWMENNNFWIWGWLRWDDENGRLGDEEACAEWREKCLEAAEILKGFDTVINVCEWSKIPPLVWKDDSTNPFLCNYACYGTNGMPNYFPARDGFRESCALLQSKGIKIQPYIDTRLWDIHTPNYETEGKALATKGADGVPYYEFYQQVDKEGKPQNLAVPCVYTQRWQDIIADTVGKLVNEYKVDGVYLDQTAAKAHASSRRMYPTP
ncbi:MAG: DUF6259 domain-containing protein, partial [Christensenellales bacterium]